jgi:hypothetical protein
MSSSGDMSNRYHINLVECKMMAFKDGSFSDHGFARASYNPFVKTFETKEAFLNEIETCKLMPYTED